MISAGPRIKRTAYLCSFVRTRVVLVHHFFLNFAMGCRWDTVGHKIVATIANEIRKYRKSVRCKFRYNSTHSMNEYEYNQCELRSLFLEALVGGRSAARTVGTAEILAFKVRRRRKNQHSTASASASDSDHASATALTCTGVGQMQIQIQLNTLNERV